MKKRSATGRHMKLITAMLITLFLLALAPSAQAYFYDDFEDGNHDGWLLSHPGGSGSTSVVDHNASQMAYITHTGTYSHALSRDFNYVSSDIISFDMHAETLGSEYGTDAWGGVTGSFLV